MKSGLIIAGTALLARISNTLQQHPKRVTAALAAVLLTGGGGAFAVASLGPDPADLPVRTLTQQVASLADDTPLVELTELQDFALYRSDLSRSNDNAEALLQRLGVADPQASAYLRSNDQVRQHLLARGGRLVSAEATNDHQLTRLTARWAPDDDSTKFQRLVVERKDKGFVTRLETGDLVSNNRLAGGVIQSSLFAATDASNIPDAVATQLAEVFNGKIDFRRSLRKNDRFTLVYETLEADGEPLRSGRLLSAEFHNNGDVHQAMWFQEPGTKGAYYGLDGSSLERSYLSAPLAFSRVSSGFAMRFHPIQKTWRAHSGTDFAAPTGTAVRSVADGVVEFSGVQNGYGNVIFVKHPDNNVTVYAHLSRMDVRKGARVEQGATIGAVGSTGWATGPHLHFEVRVNGQAQDPLTVIGKAQAARPVSTASRAVFNRKAEQMRMALDSAGQTLASAE
ncbi:M23 family metallopeptidase [Acidovorax sp. CCYZU-2555]|uniref:M23 family metallopeptidase n=1 Tax=Acidovorax sp. CCYZU-2555 TaxID=2835042 RepID=UPI001BCCA1B2|nr:M23 family metallopeptidase [Acidovorax sp. CCYZU-2555]MBS7777340.1 M23 family metallopeptidase [Acidovorax sp. CCYZU-2555]